MDWELSNCDVVIDGTRIMDFWDEHLLSPTPKASRVSQMYVFRKYQVSLYQLVLVFLVSDLSVLPSNLEMLYS